MITPLEFIAWLVAVPLVLPPVCFYAGIRWGRSVSAEQLADLDARVYGDDAADAFIASLLEDKVPPPRRPQLAEVVAFPKRPAPATGGGPVAPYTELDAWRAEERAMLPGTESTSSSLLHLIIGGMTLRDALPARAAAAVAAIRRTLEADQ